MAGGSHPLNPADSYHGAGKSFRITHQQLQDSKPDLLIIAPCGLNIDETKRETTLLKDMPLWAALTTVLKRAAVIDGKYYWTFKTFNDMVQLSIVL